MENINEYTIGEEYNEFTEAMDDDLNTSKALAVLFELTNKANKDIEYAYTLLYKLASVLGFKFEKSSSSNEEINLILQDICNKLDENYSSIDSIVEKRNLARAEKKWDIADKIRIALDESGIILKDSKEGTTWELK